MNRWSAGEWICFHFNIWSGFKKVLPGFNGERKKVSGNKHFGGKKETKTYDMSKLNTRIYLFAVIYWYQGRRETNNMTDLFAISTNL